MFFLCFFDCSVWIAWKYHIQISNSKIIHRKKRCYLRVWIESKLGQKKEKRTIYSDRPITYFSILLSFWPETTKRSSINNFFLQMFFEILCNIKLCDIHDATNWSAKWCADSSGVFFEKQMLEILFSFCLVFFFQMSKCVGRANPNIGGWFPNGASSLNHVILKKTYLCGICKNSFVQFWTCNEVWIQLRIMMI